MAFDFSVFNRGLSSADLRLDEDYVSWLVNEQAMDVILHHEKLWRYYRNDTQELAAAGASKQGGETSRPYRQAQEYGLPSRITGMNYSFYGGIMNGAEMSGIQR